LLKYSAESKAPRIVLTVPLVGSALEL